MKNKKYGYRAKKAQEKFNRFIVIRDTGKPCISCGRYLPLTCGHFRSVGACPELRFDEENAYGQCVECNGNKSGNVAEYRIQLIEKIGLERVERLEGYHPPKHYTVYDLFEIEKEYEAKCGEQDGAANMEYYYESA
ncbi:recombination protein NinG [Vibrio harveyi]|uniref:recombination protein NinG n=1 Tax=Vibrio harveyi TaxID=669 RepID=UPI003CF8A49A